MFLKTVIIRNYRSIDQLTLNFDSNLKIFVGKNESGKSNIIKALSLLLPETLSSVEDIRETLPDEKLPDVSVIWFVFEADSKDKEEVYQSVKAQFDNSIDVDERFIKEGSVSMNLRDFCNFRSQMLYVANVSANSKYYSFWSYDNKNKSINKTIVKEKSPLPAEEPPIFTEQRAFDPDLYELIKPSDIDKLITNVKSAILQRNHPDVLYWTYNEENLLPSRIDVNEFSADPEICKPLKYLFQLAGIGDIKKEIEVARKGSSNKYRNFLNKIADHATDHFKNTWKEYKGISFSLEPNGEYIETGVKEKNTYTFQQRSDGFKRFITFLLMVSVNAKNDKLRNTIILVDEPDLSLHPSGVRYLRDELKKISLNNIVVAATHSIFMIDGNDISSYFIVKKEDEKTIVETPTEKNIAAEEVLYRALDFSVYELLKDSNILFEGWRDKKLFQTAITKLTGGTKEFYNNIGVSHTSGVKNVKNITPIFELTGKKCIILSDSDKAARDKQKEFKKEKNVGLWLRYDEVDTDSLAITGEDYLTDTLIKKGVKYLVSIHNELKTGPDFTVKRGIIANVESWLKDEKVTSNDISVYIDEFKTYLFDNLKPIDVSATYYTLLEKMRHQLESQG